MPIHTGSSKSNNPKLFISMNVIGLTEARLVIEKELN